MYTSNQGRIHNPNEADACFRKRLAEILQGCGKKRPEVAQKMGVTLARLNSWCSTAIELRDRANGAKVEARRPRFPAALILLFCEATASDDLRLFFLSDRQKHLLKLGEQAEQLVAAASRRRKTQ